MVIQQKIKHHFTLIEVLLAIAILSSAIVPLLAPQLWMVKEERQFLHEIQAANLSQEYLAYFLEKIYEHQISWEELISSQNIPFDAAFWADRGIAPLKMSYSTSVNIKKLDEEDESGAFLINLDIHIEGVRSVYHSEIYVQKEGVQKK